MNLYPVMTLHMSQNRHFICLGVEFDSVPNGRHPLFADVVVLGTEDQGLASRMGEDEDKAGVFALVHLKVLLKEKESIVSE